MNEKLSAFIDAELDELGERQVLKALASDTELRSRFERYHLIKAAMTRQLTLLAPHDLADRIARELQDAKVPDVDRFPRWWRYGGGFAIAASVAALGIYALQSTYRPGVPSAPLIASVQSATPRAALPADETEQALNIYLVGHSEFMPTAGMGGMLPYVRVVTLDQDSK